MVDPKKVELTLYNKIERHYLAKLPDSEEAIITDNKKVINTLNSLCIEMDNRYELLKNASCRNIVEYNKKFKNRKLNPNDDHRFLPYVVLVVDEFADLIMTGLIVFGLKGLILIIVVAIIAILMFESVNYIEHYGLLRTKLNSGRYERVQEKHSWNSNHILGRIVLYELTRHSDHHRSSTIEYQNLKSIDNSPQLPFGYPTSILISFIPVLWFKIMNPRIPKEMISIALKTKS